MMKPTFFFIFYTTVIWAVKSEDLAPNALTLTEVELSKAIKETPHLVLFYAPWSGHYKKFAPIWNDLAFYYNDEESAKVQIVKVNCEEETTFCEQNGFKFIGIKFFSDDKSESVLFDGERTSEELETFLTEQLKKIGNGEDEEKGEVNEGEEDVEEEEDNYVEEEIEEAVVKLTADNFPGASSGHFFIKFYAPWCGHCKHLAPLWVHLAETFNLKGVTIAQVDCTKDTNTCAEYGIQGYPTLLWFFNGKQVDKYEGSRSEDNLETYIRKMKAKKSFPKKKSDIMELTSKTFDKLVKNRLVFVMFYSPTCGFCTRMKPTWADLAKQFKPYKKVKVAQIDCSGEDKDFCGTEHSAWGFPTLRIYRSGYFLEDYKSERTLTAFSDFIMGYIKKYPNYDKKIKKEEL